MPKDEPGRCEKSDEREDADQPSSDRNPTDEDSIDDALEATFPASDPPSWGGRRA